MTKRLVGITVIATLLIAVLAACSVTDNRTISGEAAKDALATVVENSVTKFDAEGGTETLSLGQTQYLLIFDPTAPEGKQVVTVNLSDQSVPTFDSAKSISIRAMQALLTDKKMEGAEYKLTDNIFYITATDFKMMVETKNDLVVTTELSGQATGQGGIQIVVTAYGISSDAQKLFDSASPATS